MKANSVDKKILITSKLYWSSIFIDLSAAVFTGLISLALYYSRSGWGNIKPKLPLLYFADPIYYANLVHNAQLGNPLLGRSLGGPAGQQFNLTAWGFEWVQSWVVSLFASASQGPWLAMNRFMLYTFFATGLFAYLAFRWMEINRPIASLCAIAFSLIPDHNTVYVGFANMSAFVLTIVIIWKISNGTPLGRLFEFPLARKLTARQRGTLNIFLIFLIALFQLTAATYFLLFGILLTGSVMIYLIFIAGDKTRIKNLAIFISIQVLATLICLAPIVISRLSSNLPFSEPSTGDRRAFAAYANGGDPFALISPITPASPYAKMINSFPNIRAFYNEYLTSPVTTGTEYVRHGGGVLFIILLAFSLIYAFLKRWNKIPQRSKDMIEKLNFKMVLVVFFLTLGWYTRGGFGTLFAFIFPYLRGYARFSAFLTFLGLAILGLLASKFPKSNMKKVFSLLVVIVLIDNASAFPKLEQNNTESMVHVVGTGEQAGASVLASGGSLRTLGIFGTQRLESVASKKLQSGCTVLELPLVTYPVDFAIGITSYYEYELIKPGLETSTLKWSAGGIQNSPNNKFTDSWLGQYQNGKYQGFFPAIRTEKYCGILFFRGIQQAFHEAGAKNGSNYGPADELSNEIIKNFGAPCYSDIESAVDLYCLKKN